MKKTISVRKEMFELVEKLYNHSDSFTTEDKVVVRKGNGTYTVSVAPLHQLEALEPNYFTEEEFYNYYDNYSSKEINRMIATDVFPMKLVSLWESDEDEHVGTESDPEGNIFISLNEATGLFNEDYIKFESWLKSVDK